MLDVEMKSHIFVATILLTVMLFVVAVNIAHAQWSAISSGYAVTTDWHGEEVPVGQTVTAWAGTTNSEVEKVEFKWMDPDENVIFDENVTVFGPYTTPDVPPNAPQQIINWANDNPEVTIYYANNTQIPDEIGDWGVQVFFYAPGGHLRGQESDIIKIRASSINVTPEIPVLGTAGATLAMLLSLGFLLKRKKQH